MLALHLGLRWLKRRRSAWLALAAITLTVAVPVIVVGVMQGWMEVTARQARAAESDVVVVAPGIVDAPEIRARLAAVPGVATIAPFVQSWGVMNRPRSGDTAITIPCQVEGIDWAADWQLGRLKTAALHPQPVTDLSAPPLPPEHRGSGFLTPTWRSMTVLAGLHLATAFGGMPAALPPTLRPLPGIVCGRELLYPYGMRPGETVSLVVPNGTGGKAGAALQAEISDTLGIGVMEIDRFLVLTPLPLAQRTIGFQAKADRGARLSGWRLNAKPDCEPATLANRIDDSTGLRALTWQQLRGNLVLGMEIQRNIGILVMILIQGITVFIIYAVFSTMVVELRHDIGVLRGIGARRRDIAWAFIIAGLVACLGGGVLGWLLGWGVLAALNPFSHLTGIALFPQDVIYTPEAPTSYAWWIPPLFIGSMTVIGLIAVALPAWRAARVDPIETLREG